MPELPSRSSAEVRRNRAVAEGRELLIEALHTIDAGGDLYTASKAAMDAAHQLRAAHYNDTQAARAAAFTEDRP